VKERERMRRRKRELKNVYDGTMRSMKNKLLNIKIVRNYLHQKCITDKYDAIKIFYARFMIQIQI